MHKFMKRSREDNSMLSTEEHSNGDRIVLIEYKKANIFQRIGNRINKFARNLFKSNNRL